MVVFMISRQCLLRILLSTLLLAHLAITGPAMASELGLPSFFRSNEIRLASLSRFSKWTEALARYEGERQALAIEPCGNTTALACHYRDWLGFLDTLRGASKRRQIDAVNAYFNARPYVADRSNYGREDHWATPGEFLSRSGDCEDYAIAKYLSLRELGWTDDELRVVAVRDENLGIGHAIVVVFLDGETWVLDNQLSDVIETDAVPHYRPVYSINATSWWLHRSRDRA